MLVIKVISSEGWQNGEDLYEQGKTLNLECEEEDLKAWIDDGIIEVVKKPQKTAKVETEEEKEARTVGLVAKSVVDAIAKLNPKDTTIRVTERVKDDPRGGFKSISEFGLEVYKHATTHICSEKLAKYDAVTSKTTGHMSEGDDVQGGHLVPTEFRNTLLQTSLERAIVRQRATFVPMGTNSVGIPAVHDYTHASGTNLYGALKILRPGEGGSKTASKPNFDKVTLTLHKLVAFTYVSDELMEDSPISIEPLLNGMFGAAIAWHEDNDFINGTGVNQPLGILNAPALISFARNPAAGYLSYLDLCNMWSRLHPMSMPNAVWLVSPSMLPYLYTACVTCTGSDGSDLTGHPVMLPSAGASESPYNTIFGRPVIVTEHCQAAGTSGDIYLCDWTQYLIGGKSGQGTPQFASSMHLSFNTDETAFRAVMRNDGQPWWKSTLTPKFDTNTLSPFVTLNDKS